MRVASDPSFLRALINHSVYPIDLLGAPAKTEASHWFVNHSRLTAVPLCATFSAPSASNASSRLLLIMSFAENSGMIDSVHRTRELYGLSRLSVTGYTQTSSWTEQTQRTARTPQDEHHD